MLDLHDTMVHLPDTMVDLPETMVDLTDTMVDLPDTIALWGSIMQTGLSLFLQLKLVKYK